MGPLIPLAGAVVLEEYSRTNTTVLSRVSSHSITHLPMHRTRNYVCRSSFSWILDDRTHALFFMLRYVHVPLSKKERDQKVLGFLKIFCDGLHTCYQGTVGCASLSAVPGSRRSSSRPKSRANDFSELASSRIANSYPRLHCAQTRCLMSSADIFFQNKAQVHHIPSHQGGVHEAI